MSIRLHRLCNHIRLLRSGSEYWIYIVRQIQQGSYIVIYYPWIQQDFSLEKTIEIVIFELCRLVINSFILILSVNFGLPETLTDPRCWSPKLLCATKSTF